MKPRSSKARNSPMNCSERSPDKLFESLREHISRWYVNNYGPSLPRGANIEFYASGTKFRVESLLGCLANNFTNRPPRRILDVGCGYGSIALYLAWLWPDAQILATDQTNHYFKCGEQAAKQLGMDNIRFKPCSAENLEFRPAFDLVLSCNMLNFLCSKATLKCALKNFASSTEKNGYLIIHTPHFWSFREPFTKIPFLHYFPTKVQDFIAQRTGKRSLLSDTRNPSLREIKQSLREEGLQLMESLPSGINRVRSTHITAWFTKRKM